MPKDKRVFAPFPIEMDEHPKIIGLSDRAFRALIESTFYCRRRLTDGFIDERVVRARWGVEAAAELERNDPARPSWIRVEGGWQIHDFLEFHPSRAEIEAKQADVSAVRSEAGRRGGLASGKQRRSNGEATGSNDVANRSAETETETKISPYGEIESAVPPRADVERLLDLLDEAIESSGGKRPSRTQRNRDAMRLLLDRDGRSVEQVANAIRWAHGGDREGFWRGNVLSAVKLRKHYDQMRLQAQRQGSGGGGRVLAFERALDGARRAAAAEAAEGQGAIGA